MPGGHPVADDLGRHAEGGLDHHAVLGVAAVDHGVVAVQDAGRLVADAHQHAVQVQALVQRLGRARQRRLLGHLHGALAGHAQLRQRGRGGGGERLRHLHLLVGEGAALGVGQHQDVPAPGLDLHRQRQQAAGRVHRPQRRVQRQRGVAGGERHGVVLGRVAQHGELVHADRARAGCVPRGCRPGSAAASEPSARSSTTRRTPKNSRASLTRRSRTASGACRSPSGDSSRVTASIASRALPRRRWCSFGERSCSRSDSVGAIPPRYRRPRRPAYSPSVLAMMLRWISDVPP